MTNISIITNFGCASQCWYCVWKDHHLRNQPSITDWEKLESFMSCHKDKGKVSISGGGDPLYKFNQLENWWKALFHITTKYNMLVDLHTRVKLYDASFWKQINRCSFSSDVLEDDVDYLCYLSKVTRVRIVYVVTATTKISVIQQYADFCEKYKIQLTLKELFKYNDHGKYNEIKKTFPNLFYLDNGDYNIYFMPNNTITDKFTNN